MRQVPRLLIIFSMLTALVLLAGCGTNGTSGVTGPPATTTIAPSSTSTVRTGSVALRLNPLVYRANDTISVTVSNQSNQAISFSDHLTNCTVILLLRQKVQPQASGSGQDGINPCKSEITTRIHSLGPGQHFVVQLIAPSNGWPLGVYRATLSYRVSLLAGPFTTISSTAFTVGPLAPQP